MREESVKEGDVEGGWGSRVLHSVSWHLWLARMFRMVFSPFRPFSSPRYVYPVPLSSSAGSLQLDPTRRCYGALNDERERKGLVLYYGPCSQFLESLISVLLVLFPCRSRPLPENRCSRRGRDIGHRFHWRQIDASIFLPMMDGKSVFSQSHVNSTNTFFSSTQ